ncbi:MAG TPA: hypothetical protein VJ809_10395 [Pirellulales bacterium]|nr:hypothetical protein [Pirellulales bacterium]
MLFSLCHAAAVAASLIMLASVGPALAFNTAPAEAANNREPASLEAAARRYRVQVYETYRLDRAEFDRRRAAGDAVQARWREAGGRKEDLSAVLEWLRHATYLSQPEVRQRLPGLPEFGASRSIATKSDERAVVPERIAPAAPQRSDHKEMLLPPASRNSTPGVVRRPPPAPRANGYEIAPPRRIAPPATVQGALTPPSARQPARAPSGPTTGAVQPRVGRALLPAPWEVISSAPSQPTAGASSVPRRGIEISRPTTPSRAPQPSRVPGAVKVPERAVTAAAPGETVQPSTAIDARREPHRATAGTATFANRAESADVALPPRLPTLARRQGSNGSGHDQSSHAAQAPRVALARPTVSRSIDGVRWVPATRSQSAELPEPVESQLDVGELLARASGYGFGLRTIDSVLGEQASLNAAELTKLLGELEALVEQRGDLLLYEQLVNAEVRRRLIGSLAFPQATIAALGSRIAAVREQLTQQSDLAAGEREVKLRALAELSKRLSRLSQQ